MDEMELFSARSDWLKLIFELPHLGVEVFSKQYVIVHQRISLVDDLCKHRIAADRRGCYLSHIN